MTTTQKTMTTIAQDLTTEVEILKAHKEVFQKEALKYRGLRDTICSTVWEISRDHDLDLCERGVEAFCDALGVPYSDPSVPWKITILVDFEGTEEQRDEYVSDLETAATNRGAHWVLSDYEEDEH